MKRFIAVLIALALLFMFSDSAEASTCSMVHNGPGRYSGWVQMPWSSQHYNYIPSIQQRKTVKRPAVHKPAKKKTVKRRR